MATAKHSGEINPHIESTDAGLDHLKNVDLHDKALANDALEATADEHSYGVIQGFKTYKAAALWSIRKSLIHSSYENGHVANDVQSSQRPSSWKATTSPF